MLRSLLTRNDKIPIVIFHAIKRYEKLLFGAYIVIHRCIDGRCTLKNQIRRNLQLNEEKNDKNNNAWDSRPMWISFELKCCFSAHFTFARCCELVCVGSRLYFTCRQNIDHVGEWLQNVTHVIPRWVCVCVLFSQLQLNKLFKRSFEFLFLFFNSFAFYHSTEKKKVSTNFLANLIA